MDHIDKIKDVEKRLTVLNEKIQNLFPIETQLILQPKGRFITIESKFTTMGDIYISTIDEVYGLYELGIKKPLFIYKDDDDVLKGIDNFIIKDTGFSRKNETLDIFKAIRNNDVEAVDNYINDGEDVNLILDHDGFNFLMWASEKGHVEIIDLIIKSGADINAETISGYTALMYASGNGQIGAVKTLIDNGSNIYAKSKNGDTALSLATNNPYEVILQVLKDNGAK